MHFAKIFTALIIPTALAAPQTSSSTILKETASALKSACPLDSLTIGSPQLQICVTAVAKAISSLKTQEERALIFSALMFSSTKYSGLLTCAPWKSGPKSQACIDAVTKVKASLKTDAEKQFAGYIHTDVFSNPQVAVCTSSTSLVCKI